MIHTARQILSLLRKTGTPSVQLKQAGYFELSEPIRVELDDNGCAREKRASSTFPRP